MLTFKYESNNPLIGCGIDGETIKRFTPLSIQEHPLPMVFSTSEINHIRTLDDQAVGFCASFCCKEAFYKAFGHPLNFIECELFYNPLEQLQHPTLSLTGDNNPTINDCTVKFYQPKPEEMVAIVHLYGRGQT